MIENRERRRSALGFTAGAFAYLIWGILPLYWKVASAVPAVELLAWRIAGCGLIAWAVMLFRLRRGSLTWPKGPVLARLALAAILITANWSIYIWAVMSERLVEASLGYYINPLVNVALGVLFLKEHLGRIRGAAVALALVAIILLTLRAGVFPWLSLLLAFSFGFYGLVVKKLPGEMDSMEILAWEMVFISPIALGILLFQGMTGQLHFIGLGVPVTLVLAAAGVVTLLPLWLFGEGARRIPLGVMGFLQYTAPTMMLLIGVMVFGEEFDNNRIIAFVLVALALVLYSITLWRPPGSGSESAES